MDLTEIKQKIMKLHGQWDDGSIHVMIFGGDWTKFEDTCRAISELKNEGKIKYLGNPGYNVYLYQI